MNSKPKTEVNYDTLSESYIFIPTFFSLILNIFKNFTPQFRVFLWQKVEN